VRHVQTKALFYADNIKFVKTCGKETLNNKPSGTQKILDYTFDMNRDPAT
jgi:hypothetical protein